MTTALEKLQQQLAPLRAAYVASLPDLERKLRHELEQFAVSGGQGALRETLHQTIGTAGTYGFIQIAEAARALAALADTQLRIAESPQAQALCVAVLAASAMPLASPGALDAPNPSRAAPRVLLIDDAPSMLRIARLALERAGYTVVVAASAEHIVRLATESRAELVLLDVHMPGVNGVQGLHRLRADASTNAIPVVFLTADAEPARVAELIAAGAIGVLEKPFKPLALAAELQAVCARAGIVWNIARK